MNHEIKEYDLRDASRPFDIHVWSSSPQHDCLVDDVIDYCLKQDMHFNAKEAKFLKVLILDLYVAHNQKYKYLSMSRDKNAYKTKTRYNRSGITYKIVSVSDSLIECGLLIKHNHIYTKDCVRYVTRIQPSPQLIKIFNFYKFNEYLIFKNKDAECITLRDKNKIKKDYIDSPKIRKMRNILNNYNALLERNHIDCCHLKTPFLIVNNNNFIPINHSNVYTKRIFNNNWKSGGRFYGGFWQQISKSDKQHIRINGERTVEVDYSGLHVTLLYALKGILYWEHNDYSSDPYTVEIPGLSAEDSRYVGKALLLTSINAKNEKDAFKAVRQEINKSKKFDSKFICLTDKILKDVLESLKAKHLSISDQLCSGVGVKLQFIDSQITEDLICCFIENDIPILTVHDSYIVSHKYVDLLIQEMEKAFVKHTGLQDVANRSPGGIFSNFIRVKQIGYHDEYLDYDFSTEEVEGLDAHKDMVSYIDSAVVPEYLDRLKRFQEFRDKGDFDGSSNAALA